MRSYLVWMLAVAALTPWGGASALGPSPHGTVHGAADPSGPPPLLGAVSAAVQGRDRLAALARARVRREELVGAFGAERMQQPVAALSRTPAGRSETQALRAGDLLTASDKKFSALRVIVQPDAAKVRRSLVGQQFVPRGIDFSASRQLLAVAAVSRVVLYRFDTGEVTVLSSPGELASSFGFANDVLFEDGSSLLIADHGAEFVEREPRDGHLWQYDLDTGEFRELAQKRALSNPSLLARDADGQVFVVDREGGSRISLIFDFFYDTVYRITGKNRLRAKAFYSGDGLQATAFDIGPDGRFWFGNADDLVILDGGVLSRACAVPRPFQFVTGIAVADGTMAYVLDGTSRGPLRSLYESTDECVATLVSSSRKLKGARGLVQVVVP